LKKPEKLISGGKGGLGPHFWSTIFFNRPEMGAGEFEPPQIFGPATKTYCQFTAICRNLPQFATIHCNLPQFAAIRRNLPQLIA
jgi:hypothetical protein